MLSYLYDIVDNYFPESRLLKLGFPIDVHSRLSSLRRFIVFEHALRHRLCFEHFHASPNPRACINLVSGRRSTSLQSISGHRTEPIHHPQCTTDAIIPYHHHHQSPTKSTHRSPTSFDLIVQNPPSRILATTSPLP